MKNGQYILLPPAPDPQQVGYGQPYAGVYLRTTIGEARFKQDFGDNWHLVAGILNRERPAQYQHCRQQSHVERRCVHDLVWQRLRAPLR